MVLWHHLLNGHKFEPTLGDSEGRKPGTLQFMGSQRSGHDLVTEQQMLICFFSPQFSTLKCFH